MQLARGGLPRPRMTLASFVLVSDLNGSRLDLGGRFRAATGKKRKAILYQNPTTHGYPHTRYCLLRASSTGRNNRRAFLFSLYSISLRRVAVGCWCSCSLPKIGKIKNRLAVWPSRNEAAQGKFTNKRSLGLRTALRGCGAAERPRLPLTIVQFR